MIERTKHVAALCLLLLAATAPTAQAADGWPWPVEGDVITPYKNGDDPYAGGQHRGIDIAAPLGSAVRASIGGDVTFAGKLPDGGLTVTVRGGRYLVSYLHLGALGTARGAQVSAGARIGEVGATGKRSAEQPHLHFGVRLEAGGAYVDPLPLLTPRAVTRPPAAKPAAPAERLAAPAPRAGRLPRVHVEADAVPRHTATRGRQAPRPNIVHAPAYGDSVAEHPVRAAGDSARESHASTGNGRVAPPPLPELARLSTPGRAAAPEPAAVRPAQHSSRLPLGALALAGIAGITLLARRRRRTWWDDLLPSGGARAEPESPKVGSAGVLLRDNADLLRQRRAASGSRVLDDRR
ncbi:MAG: peptidoglycan DD-metalloendopeptidase family protein [Solirubrobacterales bacterium]